MLVQSLLSAVQSQMQFSIPSKDDYAGSLSALIRLQHVYKMSVDEMYNGLYLGFQGPSLQPEDVYDIGRQAFIDGYLEVSFLLISLRFY